MTEEKPKRGALLYYQLASVILLLVLVGFSISGLWGLVKIAIPKLTTENYEWKLVSTFDRYVQDKYREKNGIYYSKFEKEDTTIDGLNFGHSKEEVETKWKSAQQNVLDDERREGLRMIMLWFVVMVVCLPLYLYHHKAVKKGRPGSKLTLEADARASGKNPSTEVEATDKNVRPKNGGLKSSATPNG